MPTLQGLHTSGFGSACTAEFGLSGNAEGCITKAEGMGRMLKLAHYQQQNICYLSCADRQTVEFD